MLQNTGEHSRNCNTHINDLSWKRSTMFGSLRCRVIFFFFLLIRNTISFIVWGFSLQAYNVFWSSIIPYSLCSSSSLIRYSLPTSYCFSPLSPLIDARMCVGIIGPSTGASLKKWTWPSQNSPCGLSQKSQSEDNETSAHGWCRWSQDPPEWLHGDYLLGYCCIYSIPACMVRRHMVQLPCWEEV